MTDHRIAVVGIACRYPDADSAEHLWQNVLAGRRAFRRLPDERMNLDDYYSPDRAAPDRFYSRKAAVLEGFDFDRVHYRVAGSTFRSTDMTHWLALDTAARALRDAGFPDGDGLPRSATGVVIGNTLTGEFSRANLMRLRWPYVRRTVGAALREQGWDDAALGTFLAGLETRYKSAFPPIDEDTLAGGLANTIAGRVCNHFDLHGGGFTVDGACSSSLLSVATAANALASGQLEVAVAGGVDLSIDPFEVIGFAKTGALATGEMRVYDRGSNGFWPGEGCGMLVLMRDEDAIARGLRRYAVLAGWGYSSDGRGGITRPEAAGHQLALRRAYELAGYGIETVAYIEGHGTGTAVGDATELRAFSEARRAADPTAPPAAISTIKGNIGHTKAAAGVAGLIKAILAVHHEVIPPATSHLDPHPELTGDRPALRVPLAPEPWPAGRPIRSGVSSMGFGGINAHVVVEHADSAPDAGCGPEVQALARSRQDAELLLVDADDFASLRGRIAQLAELCGKLSFAELGDLAATLQHELSDRPFRAAIVAGEPEEAGRRFDTLLTMLDNGARSVLDTEHGVFAGTSARPPRIGFLFPGQGAGRRGDGGALRRRFADVDELYRTPAMPFGGDPVATENAQPRIVTSSVAGLRTLAMLGITAVTAAGHSLGELTALHWAGAMDEAALLRTATARGRIMAQASAGGGTMASIVAPPETVGPFLTGEPVVIAGYNSPRQTVVSGPADAVKRVCERAVAQGLSATGIPVSHAFHSEAVAPAATAFRDHLRGERFADLTRAMVSTVTGAALPPGTDVPDLLTRQVLEPVRFTEAVHTMAQEVDLFIEVGPGRILRNLAAEIAPAVPAVSLEADSMSLSGLLHAVGIAFALGAPVRHDLLFHDRFTRPFPFDRTLRFLTSPCESAPLGGLPALAPAQAEQASPAQTPQVLAHGEDVDTLDVLRRLAAERAELPLDAVSAQSNPIDELHLSSITVGQIVTQASKELGLAAPLATSAFATSTLAQLAEMLDELGDTARSGEQDAVPDIAGAGPWVRAFSVALVPVEAGRPAAPPADGDWQLFATDRHPLAPALHAALRRARLGSGVLLCLPHDCAESHTALMLAAARAALAPGAPGRFVIVGDRRGAAGLAKTLHLEAPGVTTTLITVPLAEPAPAGFLTEIVPRIVADVAATSGFSETLYDATGARHIPLLRPLPTRAASDGPLALDVQDVLLVTGGGKGITAECALDLARATGAAVALMGRSDPNTDPELAANLARMAGAGVSHRYVRADITSADEVKAAVQEVRQTLGPVTAVLHGAGRNVPHALADLDESSFRRTLAPKITGLETVLAATDPATLRFLVTFGSIIGRAGLRGEADYATANDWLTDLTYRIQEEYPDCRCLALEWSVWSGTGMGERLGVLESLMREGIRPIPPQEGVAVLRRLLADPHTPTSVVVMGRAENLPTLALEPRELPLLRFVDRPRVHYPRVELVVDADLGAADDLYLADHLLDGDLLFPAVFGMEAMTQAAIALTGRSGPPVLEDVEFLRPVVVPVEGRTTIRVAALATDEDTVQVVLRSDETAFQADHFRATLRFGVPLPLDTASRTPTTSYVPLAPNEDLYGPVLFQGGRFQRLLGYRDLAARHCVADVSTTAREPWFGGFLPSGLVLADPGTRDALMHAIQCCVPDATLLPAAIERLHLADPARMRTLDRVTLHATERSHDGDTYVYDLDVRDPAGALVERWEGLRLQAVRKQDGSGPWTPTLLGPYLERRCPTVLPTALHVAVWPDGADAVNDVAGRRGRTARALTLALGREPSLSYRPDGKPEADGRVHVSSSHGAGVTFAVAARSAVGCDVEEAVRRPAQEWNDLLGTEGFALAELIAGERDEDLSIAATRVWGAQECLRKTGHARAQLVETAEPTTDRWVVLRSGDLRIATFPTTLRGRTAPVVFTMLTDTKETGE
ncbi:SDR family NAD(P)-dependent oxidoreductase [Streptomyces sp. NPDC048416]|uniref:SDR family NAD(P)-dependent oxidoreductase n=1 Tax=Streptomyces sp. NPDC048416 TaxID=3365546 RepID=UPI003711321D